VRYLVQGVARLFPQVTTARAIGTWAGVRPTLYEWGPNEDALSRDHRVVDHAADGADGLFSMVGGKLASYRMFAEEMADVLAARLGNSSPGRTHSSPLPGGDVQIDPLALARSHRVDPTVSTRLEYRHGSRAERVLERALHESTEREVVCPCEPVIEAEIRYVVKHEWARTVDDVARRTRLGHGACGGMRCAGRCGAIVAEMTGQSPAEGRRLSLEFLEAAARRRMAALNPLQARQEALSLATIRSALGEPEQGDAE
jgi:glycerol-3-phosphate dehydrogenase